jgi:alkaline phosphatase D
VTRRPSRTLPTSLALALLVIGVLAASLPACAQPADDPAGCLAAGPMLGPAEPNAATIWVQTRHACRVQVRLWPQGHPEAARLSPEVRTTGGADGEDGGIALLRLAGLGFGTRYDYELYLDGRRVERPYPLTLQTQAMWQYRTDPPSFRAALGSCAYINDAPFDRPGAPYGGDYQIFESIAAQRPDLMIWLGDNVYYRGPDWLTEEGMRHRWAHDRALPELQPLLGTVHHYATWDDHDYGPNNSDRTFRLREASLRVFRDHFPNPSFGTAETPGVFTRFEWADAEFFLLDGRYYRSPDEMPDGPGKRMLGKEQMDWLKEALAGSQATFKIVVSGSQILNPLTFFEALGNFPAEQKELLGFLRDARIEGVVFLSGDRHHTELIRRQEPGLYPLYDFTSSPLTSGGSRLEREANNPARVPGTWVTDGTRNFGLLEVSGKPGERALTLRTLDAKGKELWKHEIREKELRFSKTPQHGK